MSMLWRRGILAASMALLLAAAPARADSLTWGYDYQRDRVTMAPIAADAALPNQSAATGTAPLHPHVAPLPGQSQSTPVVFHGRWYLWTYWAGGRAGALWTGSLGPLGSTSPGTALRLPGQPSPVVQSSPGEHLDEPADAAISPDGAWIAFGVGKYLYWWPTGRPRDGVRVVISGVEPTQATSTSPTFVPDPGASSGWAVCSGNWDGAEDCFAVDQSLFHLPLAAYLVTATLAADGDGYTPITSSAAYDPATRQIYFGVGSWQWPRVMAMNPLDGRTRVLDGRGCGCAARVALPVAAAVAVRDGAAYAADVGGDVYRFDTRSGRLTAAYVPGRAGAALDIVSPAVSPSAVFVAEDGLRQVAALDSRTLVPLGRWTVAASGGQTSAVTVAESPGAPDELFYGLQGGGVAVALPACLLQAGPAPCPGGPQPLVPLYFWPGAPTGGAGYDFTAPVVDGADVLLWSDAAADGWRVVPGTVTVAPSVPGAPAPPAGGLQVYRLLPRLFVFASGIVGPRPVAAAPATAVVGRSAPLVYVLVPPGAVPAASVRGPDGTSSVPLSPADSAAAPCPEGPNTSFGAFPFVGGIWPAKGCGPLSTAYTVLQAYAVTQDEAALPAAAGMAPRTWRDAGVGYDVWTGSPQPPGRIGDYAVSVTARLPDGQSAGAQIWYPATCASGFGADAAGRCSVCLAHACAQCPIRSTCMPSPGCLGSACAGSCGPAAAAGHNGLTPTEYALLCRTAGSWLTDAAVAACYGGWWAWVQSAPGAARCQ